MSGRSLSLGVGAGLLLATLIFGAADALRGTTQQAPSTPSTPNTATSLTPEQLKQSGEAQGLVVLAKAEYEQRLTQARTEAAQQKEAELAGKSPAGKVFVYIPSGVSAGEAANLLQTAGVIENAAQLTAMWQAQSNPIRIGSYQFALKSDPKDVLAAITAPPSS